MITKTSNKFIRLSETYISLQGEGIHSGYPCFFIRTAGCDLKCNWCDSPAALSASSGNWISKNELIAKIPTQMRMIQITGGEPLLQKKAVFELSQEIHQAKPDCKILLETGGHISLQDVPDFIHIVMDIKLTSSSEKGHDFAANLDYLKPLDEIKFVIADRADYMEALDWIQKFKLDQRFQVLISTVWDHLPLQNVAEWILSDNIQARFQIQLHKIIWGNKEGI